MANRLIIFFPSEQQQFLYNLPIQIGAMNNILYSHSVNYTAEKSNQSDELRGKELREGNYDEKN